MKKYGFTLFELSEFERWLKHISVAREILYLQQHHTWSPSYKNFDGNNHFTLQKKMKEFHVRERGWDDIGQHFTIFPDGKIMTGRKLHRQPACIYGNNRHALCIENLGNFDKDGDVMATAQEETIIAVTAAILKRFPMIKRDDTGIVYHHWFDLETGQRKNGRGTTKTCPGSNFFGGNKVRNFSENFLPSVIVAAGKLKGSTQKVLSARYVVVEKPDKIIRSGPRSTFPLIYDHGRIDQGAILQVYKEKNHWYKISKSKSHWVYSKHTADLKVGHINVPTAEVRSGPAKKHNKMTDIQKDDVVFIHGNQGNWYCIGADLWVHKSFVS